MSTTVLRLRIEGRVQGVGYRAWAVKEANELGVHGWVCNRSDGSVEALIAGERTRVEQMLSLCGRGPAFARVDDIVIEESAGPVLATGFRLINEAERDAQSA